MLSLIKSVKREAVFQFSRNFPIKIHRGALVGKKLYGNIFYNRRVQDFSIFNRIFSIYNIKKDVVIDVGANIGTYSLFFSAHFGNVYSFEPNPIVFKILVKNMKINNMRNLYAFNLGISDSSHTEIFIAKRYSHGTGTFKPDRQQLIANSGEFYHKNLVEVITIDEFAKNRKLTRIDFMKIDTEGYEPSVFRGMRSVMCAFKPIILFELHGKTFLAKQGDLKEIHNIAKNYNYSLLKIEGSLKTILVTNSNINKLADGAFLAIHKKMKKC